MSNTASDLEHFHRFLGEKLALGDAELSPEECLDLWRSCHPSPRELSESLDAIAEGLAQARRGEGMPVEEFARSLRERHKLSDDGA